MRTDIVHVPFPLLVCKQLEITLIIMWDYKWIYRIKN